MFKDAPCSDRARESWGMDATPLRDIRHFYFEGLTCSGPTEVTSHISILVITIGRASLATFQLWRVAFETPRARGGHGA